MQCSPAELKEKLLKALDQDNNVVDMAGVLAVIATLESYPITKEALEQTRLGKYVNELRRKTSDSHLAKRAKKLVRNWLKLVNSESSAVSGEKNGNALHSSLVTAGLNSCPNSPAVSQNQRLVSPALNKQLVSSSLALKSGISSRSSTPSSFGGSQPNTPKIPASGLVAGHLKGKPSTPGLPSQSVRGKIKPNTPNHSQYSKSGLSPHLSSYVSSPKLHSTPKCVNSPKISSVTNSNHASPVTSPQLLLERPDTPLSGSSSRPQTPVLSTKGGTVNLPRNVSVESLTNLSMHSNASAEDADDLRSNHSIEVSPILKTSSPISTTKPDQSLNVKTNVANKKRSRESTDTDGKPSKISKGEYSNGWSSSFKNTVNGTLLSENSETSVFDNTNSVTPDTKLSSFSSKRNANLPVKIDRPALERSSSSSSFTKTPKVKTTAQLIAELQAKSGSTSVGSSVIKQIESNQISKEADVNESILPPGMRKRKKKKDASFRDISTPQKPCESLSKTKTELVEKFLQSSVQPEPADDLSIRFDVHCLGKTESQIKAETILEDTTASNHSDTSFRPSEVKTDEHDSGTGIIKEEELSGKDSKPKRLSYEDVYNMLPPIDYNNIITEEEEEPVQEACTGGSAEGDAEVFLPRLHEEQWEYVNGTYSAGDVWRDWTQTLSRSSYDNTLLPILPYVLIDD